MATSEPLLLKVIACEIAFREISFLAAQSPHAIDVEFVTQGLHDHPDQGHKEVQRRVDATPAGKYDAILLGYGLCGNIIRDLKAAHTRLVIPRAHDCITLFLGSRRRYQDLADTQPGSYFYTSGWLECLRRRGSGASSLDRQFLPAPAGQNGGRGVAYAEWVQKYGAEQADYLMEVLGQWTSSYSHGVLIEFGFTKALELDQRVQGICHQRGWHFEKLAGDLGLFERWLNGQWSQDEFLTVEPGQRVMPSYDDAVVRAEAADIPSSAIS
jgi:hypothetical protein